MIRKYGLVMAMVASLNGNAYAAFCDVNPIKNPSFYLTRGSELFAAGFIGYQVLRTVKGKEPKVDLQKVALKIGACILAAALARDAFRPYGWTGETFRRTI